MKEALYSNYQRLVFRAMFSSEVEIRRQTFSVTNVDFIEGICYDN